MRAGRGPRKRMRFVSYSPALAQVPKISVDGLVDNALNLTHWPGNNTPQEFKADITAEIAFKFVRSPRSEEMTRGIEILTNNHFDSDGVIPVWVLLNPEEALEHESRLVAAARCGDFDWVENEEALKMNLTIDLFGCSPLSPLRKKMERAKSSDQVLYDFFLDDLIGIYDHVDRYESLWGRRLAKFHEFMDARKDVAEVKEDRGLFFASIGSERRLPSLEQANLTRMDRVLFSRPVPGGGTMFEFRNSPYSWYDIVSRPYGKRVDLHAAAATLNKMETSRDGRWHVLATWTENLGLYFGDGGGWAPKKSASRLDADDVRGVLVDHFRSFM